MGKINEIYLRDTRDQLGRYPNWPINKQISLGKIGYYYGREATFSWETELESLGINITSQMPQQFMSEIYTSRDSVSISFDIDSTTGFSQANFDFAKKCSVATQGHDIGYQVLDISKLKSEIINKINGGLKWDYDWVIITEIWVANGFTTLISNSNESSTKISAQTKLDSRAFNVADFNLGLQITECKKMDYQGVAEQNVQPYFQIHRLTKDHKLKLYGMNKSFWG